MGKRYETVICPTCGTAHTVVRHSTSNILHLLLTVLSFGIWLPIWFIISMSNNLREPNMVCRKCKWAPLRKQTESKSVSTQEITAQNLVNSYDNPCKTEDYVRDNARKIGKKAGTTILDILTTGSRKSGR